MFLAEELYRAELKTNELDLKTMTKQCEELHNELVAEFAKILEIDEKSVGDHMKVHCTVFAW